MPTPLAEAGVIEIWHGVVATIKPGIDAHTHALVAQEDLIAAVYFLA